MNKKLLIFGLPILALALVSAAVVIYIGQVTIDVTVTPAFEFTGESTLEVIIPGGESVTSKNLSVKSLTSVIIPLSIKTKPEEDGVNHTVNYLLDNSGGDCVNPPYLNCEKRIHITAAEAGVTTLSTLASIKWDAFVNLGYIAHVDVLIDIDNDGVKDDALVFEYDRVVSSPGTFPMEFDLGEWVNTFDDRGIVDGSAEAWLNSGGVDYNEASYEHKTLTDWISSNGANDIIGFEIEVDNWGTASDSTIKNILINGNPVEVSLLPGDKLNFNVNTEFSTKVNGTYRVITTVDVRE